MPSALRSACGFCTLLYGAVTGRPIPCAMTTDAADAAAAAPFVPTLLAVVDDIGEQQYAGAGGGWLIGLWTKAVVVGLAESGWRC